jgi:cysteinyl-tRNA synthetase
MMRIYDTALARIAELETRAPGRLSLYACGPTVSGEPHLGHGRMTVVWDVLRRYLTWRGTQVRFVSNVTDVEDKILAKAAEEGQPPEDIARRYEDLWWATQDRLGVARPDATPHATAYVEQMVDAVAQMLASGHAYEGGDGVYFSTSSIEGYGLLAHQPVEKLRSGARVEASEQAAKRSPSDFALWKLAKPGEPQWPSPWGPGRPGWHTECVVMSLDILGDDFDLHVGGQDLIFPHHENERAQALALGRHFARHWAHNGMIVDDSGEKMSKSVGNVSSLTDLLDAYGPRAFRLIVLQSHYRGPMSVGESSVASAREAVERLDAFAREFAVARSAPPDHEALERFEQLMDDDLDTPAAVAAGFDLLKQARATGGERALTLAAAVFQIFEHALGLPLCSGEEEVPPYVLERLAERDAARAARQWERADAIRAELSAEGWIIEDKPTGSTVHR